VKQLHRYIKESDENNEEVLLWYVYSVWFAKM
jgi:hypothetical protein